MGHPFFGQFPAPTRRALGVVGQTADFIAQGFDLGDAVQPQEFVPFSRRMKISVRDRFFLSRPARMAL
jgi:hypothetical protein